MHHATVLAQEQKHMVSSRSDLAKIHWFGEGLWLNNPHDRTNITHWFYVHNKDGKQYKISLLGSCHMSLRKPKNILVGLINMHADNTINLLESKSVAIKTKTSDSPMCWNKWKNYKVGIIRWSTRNCLTTVSADNTIHIQSNKNLFQLQTWWDYNLRI
jgi:hypothetical protein